MRRASHAPIGHARSMSEHTSPTPGASRRGGRLLYGSAAGLIAIFALLAGVTLGIEYALPIILLGVLVLGFFAVNDVVAKRTLERHGDDPLAVQDDETETTPTAHAIPDESALGDTEEAHAELSPVDLPPDAPGRKAAEEQAARRFQRTTRGDREGAQGGGTLGDDEEAPPSKEEGYERGQSPSAPYAE